MIKQILHIRLFAGVSKMMMILIYWTRWNPLNGISKAFDFPMCFYQPFQLVFKTILKQKALIFQIPWLLLYQLALKPKVWPPFNISYTIFLWSKIVSQTNCMQFYCNKTLKYHLIGAQLKLQNKFSVGLQTLPIRAKKSTKNQASRFHSKMLEVKKYSDLLRNSPDYYVNKCVFFLFSWDSNV